MNQNQKILISLVRNRTSPILLEECNASFTVDFIYEFIKSICCTKSELFCNVCEVCLKINQKKYFDFNFINTYVEGTSKEEITHIINEISYSSLEKFGNKFLIIYGIENLNKQISNMLLKNIENPTKNTFYIFTTRNLHRIISTIKSRCVYFKILSNEKLFKQELKKNKINSIYLDFFTSNFYSIEEVLNFYNSESFTKIVDVYDTLTNQSNSLTSIQKVLIKFKTLSYYEIAKFLFLLEPKVTVVNKAKIYSLINNLKYNLNKTLIFNEVLSIIN